MIDAQAETPVFTPPKMDTKGGVVPPGASFQALTVLMDDAEIARMRAGTHWLVIYSRIEYFDAFSDQTDPNAVRVSEICMTVRHQGGSETLDGVSMESFNFWPLGPQNTTS